MAGVQRHTHTSTTLTPRVSRSLLRAPLSLLTFNALDDADDEDFVGGDVKDVADLRRMSMSRRKSLAVMAARSDARPSLGNAQLSDLYTECINLATANKVNQKNAWTLHLIDYMEEVLMKRDEDNEAEADARDLARQQMNFQMASCTLDASVMIYSHRVDSVHKDTFKVLGSFSRGGEAGDDDEEVDAKEPGEGGKRKRARIYVSTIETNLDNLNSKASDLGSVTDPMFKKTSASFDQGGARGDTQSLRAPLCARFLSGAPGSYTVFCYQL